MKNKMQKLPPEFARYATVGIEFIAVFGAFLAAGMWLDRRLDTKVLFTLFGAAIGFAGGLYRMLRLTHSDRPSDGRREG